MGTKQINNIEVYQKSR